jgi:hypothetical protein
MFHYLRANALAASALVVALTGTSIAIVGLPHNSVGSKQIRKAGVHKSDIHAHAVTKSKLGAGVLRMEGFASAQIVSATPSNAPEVTLASRVITTKTTGRIFGFGRGRYAVVCFPSSPVRAGLYLDGAPLLGSGSPLPAQSGQAELNLFGVTSTAVASGTHTLALRADCVATSATGFVATDDVALGSIVLSD